MEVGWDRNLIPGSAIRRSSVARHVTNCATQPGPKITWCDLICTNVFQNNLNEKLDTQQESNQTNQKDGTEPETVDQRIAKLKTKVKGTYIHIIVLILSLSFNPLPHSLGLLCLQKH